MNKTDTLVEIPLEDWPKLRDLYANRKLEPNAYYLIQNYINWLDQDPSLKDSVKLYSLNGDWSDGTYIAQDHGRYINLNTLAEQPHQERLFAALQCLDKNKTHAFNGCVRIRPTIEAYLTSLGIDKETQGNKISRAIVYHIELKEALKFEIEPPKGITLSAVRIEDVATIQKEWPFYHPGAEHWLARMIKFNPSIGAFDESGNLVACCLVLPFGALGMLQVTESHKRRGLGSLMVRALAKMSAEQGVETFAGIVPDNTVSMGLFKSLGFRPIDELFFILSLQ